MPSDRSSIGQLTQISSPETVEGTAPGAGAIHQLKSIDFNLGGHGETQKFRPVGGKYTTVVAPTREWSLAPITGEPVYDEIGYVLAGILGASVDTVVLVTGQKHVHTLQPFNADAIATYSIEKGTVAIRAQSATGVLITDMGLAFSRTGVTLTGNSMGRRLLDGATMTTVGLVVAPQVPLVAATVDVFIDSTRGALGTTKLTRAFAGTLAIGTRFAGVWPLNSTLTSFAAHIESVPTATLSLSMEADAAGMAYLTNFRAGSTIYVRVAFTGPLITGGTAVNTLWLDCACKFTSLPPFTDLQGIYSIVWPMDLVDDGVSPLVATLINSTASL